MCVCVCVCVCVEGTHRLIALHPVLMSCVVYLQLWKKKEKEENLLSTNGGREGGREGTPYQVHTPLR